MSQVRYSLESIQEAVAWMMCGTNGLAEPRWQPKRPVSQLERRHVVSELQLDRERLQLQ